MVACKENAEGNHWCGALVVVFLLWDEISMPRFAFVQVILVWSIWLRKYMIAIYKYAIDTYGKSFEKLINYSLMNIPMYICISETRHNNSSFHLAWCSMTLANRSFYAPIWHRPRLRTYNRQSFSTAFHIIFYAPWQWLIPLCNHPSRFLHISTVSLITKTGNNWKHDERKR